jgi:hypothetical protein
VSPQSNTTKEIYRRLQNVNLILVNYMPYKNLEALVFDKMACYQKDLLLYTSKI